MAEKILKKTIEWIDSQKNIRFAILTGSFADRSTTDKLSDYDISLFCKNPQQLANSDNWLKDIEKEWVSIPLKYSLLGSSIPTRLVIFEGGKKIDFSFFSVQQIHTLATQGLPDPFNMGYEVLVDKDQLSSKLPLPTYTGFKEKKPTKIEFENLIKEFWFEVYHVAKYLYRQDLWSVQFRLSGIHHNILIKMICWNEASKKNWNCITHINGKNLQKWMNKDTWDTLYHVFPHFDALEGWKALKELIHLFKKLSHETSKALGYGNLTDLEHNMNRFVESLEVHKEK